ncbi:MAG: hypothetical protein GY778_05480 [bacterium]|nr:hypothetical protein [bacterium]
MLRTLTTYIIIVTALTWVPVPVLAQYPSDIQDQLERLAASDPALALALERVTQSRDALTYSPEEFREHVRVEWLEYRMSADGKTMLSVGARGSGTINATLGSGVQWIDKQTGDTQSLSYSAQVLFLDDQGLAIDVTVQADGGEAATTQYVFENLDPVTVVLKELADGTRHVARFVPVVGPKPSVVEYSDSLTISLSSAVLLADDEFAGEFTARGSIVGITSARAGMQFEFGLQPFAGAPAIGQTDGRTIRFEHQGRKYKLYSTEPIITPADDGTQWRVYVRARPADAAGSGTHASDYDTLRIRDALESLAP